MKEITSNSSPLSRKVFGKLFLVLLAESGYTAATAIISSQRPEPENRIVAMGPITLFAGEPPGGELVVRRA